MKKLQEHYKQMGELLKVLLKKVLLICGILSSLLYVGTDILAAMQWEGYSYTSQAVKVPSAVGVCNTL